MNPKPGNMPDDSRIELRHAMAQATVALSAAGIVSARVDAELLAGHLLGIERGRLFMVDSLDPEQYRDYLALIGRRAQRVPVQHLMGSAPFRYLMLAVGPGVFVPRPETELLVEWGLDALDPGPALVVDLCGGSGAVAISVATEHPGAVVHTVELDPTALGWLRRNVEATPAATVTVVAGDATDPGVLAELDGTVDLVLCNPPYVPTGTPVEPEVAVHDPAVAVFGGVDGLSVIPGIVERAARLLRPGGWFGIEHDDSHGAAVVELLRADDRFHLIEGHPDLAGRPRYATARRHGRA